MITKMSGKALFVAAIVLFATDQVALAQFPNWKAVPVRPRGELIPPLGNHLPPSYRAKMNRPTYLGGRIAYTIEPSSQEAMAWQRAWEKGHYANHAPRMETHFMYPKPWEVLGVEPIPKRDTNENRAAGEPANSATGLPLEALPGDIQPEAVEAPPGMLESSGNPLIFPGNSTNRQIESSSEELRARLKGDTRQSDNPGNSLQLAPAIDLEPIPTSP